MSDCHVIETELEIIELTTEQVRAIHMLRLRQMPERDGGLGHPGSCACKPCARLRAKLEGLMDLLESDYI